MDETRSRETESFLNRSAFVVECGALHHLICTKANSFTQLFNSYTRRINICSVCLLCTVHCKREFRSVHDSVIIQSRTSAVRFIFGLPLGPGTALTGKRNSGNVIPVRHLCSLNVCTAMTVLILHDSTYT